MSNAKAMRSATAVERLDVIRADRLSLRRWAVLNWRGWIGSLTLHTSLLLLAAAMSTAVIVHEREIWVSPDLVAIGSGSADLSPESLDDLFNQGGDSSTVDSNVPGESSVDADVERPYPGYNEDLPGVPDVITSGGHLIGRIGKGGGGGTGLSGIPDSLCATGPWRPKPIVDLNRTGLEVVFCVDATGSMGGILNECKTRIRSLVKVVTYLVPKARIGIVAYRDWKKYDLDSYEWTVKIMPLQKCNAEGVDKLQRFLRELEAYGGGDIPEAVQAGLEASVEKTGWTPGTRKIIIVFGDAPPHPEDNGLAKTYDLCKKWKDAGGVISCIDTTGGSKLMDEFREMAANGGGDATFLNDERAIIKQLIVLTFGAKWETYIDQVYATVLKNEE